MGRFKTQEERSRLHQQKRERRIQEAMKKQIANQPDGNVTLMKKAKQLLFGDKK